MVGTNEQRALSAGYLEPLSLQVDQLTMADELHVLRHLSRPRLLHLRVPDLVQEGRRATHELSAKIYKNSPPIAKTLNHQKSPT